MKTLTKSFSIIFLTLIMLVSLTSCGSNEEQQYFDEVTKLYEQIVTDAKSISGVDATTEEGYNSMVSAVDDVYNSITDLSELDTPNNYSEVKTLFTSSSEKLKDAVDKLKAVDLDSEDAATQYEEAYDVYMEGAELFQQAGEKLNEIHG